MKNRFEQQLELFKNDTVKMFGMCEDMVRSINELLSHGRTKCNFHEEENRVFQIGKDIEKQGMEMLLRQQPVATDLRRISTTFKLVYSSRRIATQVMEIKEAYDAFEDVDRIKKTNIGEIGKLAEKQLKLAIDFVAMEDEEIFKKIDDDVIDNAFMDIKDNLVEHLKDDPEYGADAMNLLMIAKYFEKIGDHSESIAENTHFIITGQDV